MMTRTCRQVPGQMHMHWVSRHRVLQPLCRARCFLYSCEAGELCSYSHCVRAANNVLQRLLQCCTGLANPVVADMNAIGELHRTRRCCLAVLLPDDVAAWYPEDM